MGWLDDYSYDLSPEAIAQSPAVPRESARLLDGTAGGQLRDRTVAELLGLLRPGDVVVVNETRVLPARLVLTKATGGRVELLLVEPTTATGIWEALVKPARRAPVGTPLYLGAVEVARIAGMGAGGTRLVELADPSLWEASATIPLPPYITEPLAGPELYQTVYAVKPGSVAAPTAGLHLSSDLLAAFPAAGVDLRRVELHIGLDTFKPVTAERLEDHVMHTEAYLVPSATIAACRSARAAGSRVVAVGTTVVRALESAARGDLSGRTGLFIRPPFDFEVVDVLLTNFHQPRSTLLMLLCAFYGPAWREVYMEALRRGYKFLSFGDAMIVPRSGAR
ncbi:MAG: tRNA preQ1(34) S-adenosylmethionine ribosyltransferase-isomerase QueA [Acidimicrobiales bacterium]